ncbi:MAG: hypothetical protein FJ138_15525 [Deltaproteobacteria bacterium]|nr:hypothetical protein [Deltaproteobacteria bacterium]
MWDYIFAGIAALLVGTTVYVVYNWEEIANKVRSWLANRNLSKSWLSRAFAVIDIVMVKFRRVVRVRTQVQSKTSTSVEVVEEALAEEGSESFNQLMKELNGKSSLSKDLMPILA